MAKQMLALGNYRFEVSTAAYQTLRRTDTWRWASQDRLGREPALQYQGPGTAEIELPGTIYPHFRGGLGQVGAMRAEANKGEPLILVDGLGNVMGKWVIKRIEETQSQPTAEGAPRKIEFSISIAKYGDDQ